MSLLVSISLRKILFWVGVAVLVLLMLVLLILFYPFRYRVQGSVKDGEHVISVRIHWLLNILTLRYDNPGPPRPILRFFGFKIYDSKRKKKTYEKTSEKKYEKTSGESSSEDNHKKRGDDKETDNIEYAETENEINTGIKSEIKPEIKSGTEFEIKSETAHYSDESADAHSLNCSTYDETGQAFWEDDEESSAGVGQKITDVFGEIRLLISKVYDTIEGSVKGFKRIRDYLNSDEWASLRDFIRREWSGFVRYTRPKLRAEFTIGLEEPSDTGYLMALRGIAFPLIGEELQLIPNFEEKVFYGEYSLKGRFNLIYLVRIILSCIREETVRDFLDRII